MHIAAVATPVVEHGQDLLEVFARSLPAPLTEKTVVCVTSKVVAVEQGRIVKLSDVIPSAEAHRLKTLRLTDDKETDAQFAELVLREADRIFDKVKEPGYVFLTLKDNILVANAGIDLSNVPKGYAVLWPDKPWDWAEAFRHKLKQRYQLNDVGVLLTDSHVKPLRRGVTGVAVAYSGFVGIQSHIGQPDIFGNVLKFTERAIADSLAASAVLIMGESTEQTPFVLIQDAPVHFTDMAPNPSESYFAPKYDLYAGIYNDHFGDTDTDS